MSNKPVMWILRLLWVAFPFAITSPASEILADHSRPVELTATFLGWSVWTIALIATLVALPISLAVLRTFVPVSIVGAVTVAAVGELDLNSVGAVVLSCLATAVALSAWVADICVDGASYGDEERFILRTPAAFLLGPVPVMWTVTAFAVLTGPILIAAESYGLGAFMTLVAAALLVVSGKSFYALARRWVVLVPAGVTIVDHIALTDPVLFPKRAIVAVGRAEVGTDAVDLSQRALGAVIEIRTASPTEMGILKNSTDASMERHSAVLITPGRPGAVLLAAKERGLPV